MAIAAIDARLVGALGRREAGRSRERGGEVGANHAIRGSAARSARQRRPRRLVDEPRVEGVTAACRRGTGCCDRKSSATSRRAHLPEYLRRTPWSSGGLGASCDSERQLSLPRCANQAAVGAVGSGESLVTAGDPGLVEADLQGMATTLATSSAMNSSQCPFRRARGCVSRRHAARTGRRGRKFLRTIDSARGQRVGPKRDARPARKMAGQPAMRAPRRRATTARLGALLAALPAAAARPTSAWIAQRLLRWKPTARLLSSGAPLPRVPQRPFPSPIRFDLFLDAASSFPLLKPTKALAASNLKKSRPPQEAQMNRNRKGDTGHDRGGAGLVGRRRNGR